MGRFADIAKGQRQRREGVKFEGLDGQNHLVDIGLLDAEADDGVLQRASEHARKRNAEPRKGDPVFDFACACEVVAVSVLDASQKDSCVPYFADAAEVRRALDRDRVHYLVEIQESLQNRASPLKKSLTDEEFKTKIVELALEGMADADPFESWELGLLKAFARSMARQLMFSQLSKSSSIGDSSTERSASTPSSDTAGSAAVS